MGTLRGISEPHPLEGCDEKECYDTMMSERTELIKARREAEDNLVKTVIQLSSALMVLLAGYAVGEDSSLEGMLYWLFFAATILLSVSVVSGLGEHRYSSKAYEAQQELVEKFYTKKISCFEEPKANKLVRALQKLQFFAFAVSLVLVGLIAVLKIGLSNERQEKGVAPSAQTISVTKARPDRRGESRCYEVGCTVNASATS